MDEQEPPGPPDEYPVGGLSLRRTAVRGAGLAMIGWTSSQGLTFAAYIVLARLIGPRDFGDFAAGSLLINYGFLFTEGGMMSALIKRSDRIDEAASTAFFAMLVSGTLLTAVGLAVSPLMGIFFNSDQVGAVAAALSPWLFLSALAIVPASLLQRRLSFVRRVAVDPISSLAFAGVAIAACASGAGVWGLVAGLYAREIVAVVSSWLFARFRPRVRLASIAMWREMASFARPVLVSEIVRSMAGYLDTVLLGKFAGTATLGQYRNGARLAAQPTSAFVDVGGYILLPTLARISHDEPRLRVATKRVLGVAAVVVVPVSFALVPLGVPIAVLTLGPIWRPAGHAIAASWGLLLGNSVISVTSELTKAAGRPDRLVRVQIFSLVNMAVLVCAGVPFGLIGVASAVSISQCVTAAYSYGIIAPLVGLHWRDLNEQLGGPVLSTVVMLVAMFAFAGLCHPLDHPEAAALLLTAAEVVVAAAVYAAALLTLDRRRRRSLRLWLDSRRSRQTSAAGLT